MTLIFRGWREIGAFRCRAAVPTYCHRDEPAELVSSPMTVHRPHSSGSRGTKSSRYDGLKALRMIYGPGKKGSGELRILII